MNMPVIPNCDIYGCLRTAVPESSVDVAVAGGVREIKVCVFHNEMFEVLDPSLYEIGLTYTNEVEMRLHPAAPSTPEA